MKERERKVVIQIHTAVVAGSCSDELPFVPCWDYEALEKVDSSILGSLLINDIWVWDG
jgi:hypothetical protein